MSGERLPNSSQLEKTDKFKDLVPLPFKIEAHRLTVNSEIVTYRTGAEDAVKVATQLSLSYPGVLFQVDVFKGADGWRLHSTHMYSVVKV